MKIPTNMTEQEVIEVIQRVSKRLSKKFSFSYYDREDIEQEAFILGMECLDRYDEDLPLENFLYTHIHNRLYNLRRKKHYLSNTNNAEQKKKLMDPINIDKVNDFNESNMMYLDDVELETTIEDMCMLIDLFLDTKYRQDYLKIKAGVYVPKDRREEIREESRKILIRNGYEPEDWGEYNEGN